MNRKVFKQAHFDLSAMTNNILPVLVAIVGVITSFGYYPQALKIIKNRSAKDVSIITFMVFLQA